MKRPNDIVLRPGLIGGLPLADKCVCVADIVAQLFVCQHLVPLPHSPTRPLPLNLANWCGKMFCSLALQIGSM